ncbi:MAG: hypothetical protein LBR35_00975, partial [Rickettsiales bacterium]|nr:hypothetical protein [Rickettsiales bacterium]
MSRTVSPSERFYNRIKKAFETKKLIGDIPVNEEEFVLLMDKFIKEYEYLRVHKPIIYDSPLLCVALVQIGIRYYDSRFWPHVKKILQDDRFSINQQTLLGDVFVSTMKRHKKLLLNDSERVNSVLMHGFVCKKYAEKFFNFLFAFYDRDLERDIDRLDRQAITDLIDVIKRNDNSGRTYFLVEQTADAVRQNTRGGKTRIKHFINLIDRAFWGESLSSINSNRLRSHFEDWTRSSEDFNSSKRKYTGGTTIKKGKKSFSSPYLKWSPDDYSFTITLPPQIVRYSENINKELYWSIRINSKQMPCREMQLYQVVTAYKSEKDEIPLLERDLFSEITADIVDSSNTVIRTFRIKKESIRFFDNDGDFLSFDSIGQGQAYSFSERDFTPVSEAVEDTQIVGDLVFTYYNFTYGDIIRLPDDKPLSVGKKVEEGLLPRGVIANAYALNDNEHLPLYSTPPSFVLIIKAGREAGTAIDVNKKRFNLFDIETQQLDLKDRSGNIGYKFNFKDFDCCENAIYEVVIDVPNDRKERFY